jgi:DNA-binding MarR family transcriptional regulator
MDDGLARIQNEMTLLFRRARVYFQSSAQVAHPELQSAAYALLAYLVDGGPTRASGLVDHFGTDKGAISRQLAQLETLGLVHRLPDPLDGRAQLVEATELGTLRCGEARSHSRKRMREQLDSWDVEDVEQLGALLAKFNQAISDPQK